MRFASFSMIHLIWALLAFSLFLYGAYRRKRTVMAHFVEKNLWTEVVASLHSQREILKSVLIICILFFIVLAFMRPQWGFQWREVKRQGLDIIVAIDTSKSMLTEDVKPSRLERSKLAVKDLIKNLSGDRIGLVAFSGSAFLVCPLTVDYSGFALSLEDLGVNTIPQGGTSLGSAIEIAIKGYEKIPNKYKAVVIITDGENLQGDPLAKAKEAQKKGIKIYCVGIGTKEGELIRIKNNQGRHEFLRDNNENFVKSRLNEGLLQQIALATGGTYVRASGAQFGLDVIYDRLSQLEKREIKSQMEKRYFERFQIPLGIALILLIVETIITTRKKE